MECKFSDLLLYSVGLVFILRSHMAAAAMFTTPEGTVTARVGRTENFVWSYEIKSGETMELISCGFIGNRHQFKVLVNKSPSGSKVETRAAFFSLEYLNRVKVYDKGNQFGMTIVDLNEEDGRKFFCQLQFSINGELQAVVNSRSLTLSVRNKK